MAVELTGEPDGGTVLLIHGMGTSSNVWLPLLPVYIRHRVIRPDLPGSAQSATALPGAMSVECMARAVREVCVELEVRDVHVVGHALGALVALHLAALAPYLVRSLVLLAPTQGPLISQRPMLFRQAQRLRRRELDLQSVADELIPGYLAPRTLTDNPICMAFLRESLMRQPVDDYARTLLAWANAQPAQAARISCPAFLLAGEQDAHSPADSVARLTDSLPQAQGGILSNCGHSPMLERLGSTSSALRRFYEGLK